MYSFKSYIAEAKNTHMEHLEDLIFNEGVAGTRRAINFLRDLRDMLSGHSKSKITATVKWDGAPAVFIGIDPRDGKFFVAKKGVFNKEPKLYKIAKEIDEDSSGDLAEKLKVSLAEFSKLGIKKGVFQGDLMFTKSTVNVETIEGQKYVTFHPNTILYAVPYDSELGKKIRSSKIGVVWHTKYEGDSFENMKAVFGQPIVPNFKQSTSVWMDDANYKDYSGTATFTSAETKQLNQMLSEIGTLFKGLDAAAVNGIHSDPDLLTLVKTFNNQKVREGVRLDPKKHVKDLFDYIYERFQKEIETKKTEKGKSAQEEKRKKILSFFANHPQEEIVKIFQMSNMLADAKLLIVNKMNQAGEIATFVKTTNGFKVVGAEGFVAIDHLGDNAVKIIDRMEFSKNNFSADIIKGWQR